MKLKTSYDAMSDVPTGYEGAYTETDGKAVLTGDDFEFKTAADVLAMHKAKSHAETNLAELKARQKSFEGIDLEKFKSLQEDNDVLRAKAKDGGSDEETIKAIVDSRVARATEALTGENGTLKEQLGEANSFKLKTEKQNLLSEAIGKQVGKDAQADAEFIIGSALERQADGSFMSNGQAGFEKGLSVEQVLAKALETRPHWNKHSTPGHGAKGAGGTANPTERSQFKALLVKDDKTRAEKQQLEQLANKLKAEQN